MIDNFSKLSCRTRCGLQLLGINSCEEARDYYYKHGNDFSSFLVARHIGKKSLIEIKAALFGIFDRGTEDPCFQMTTNNKKGDSVMSDHSYGEVMETAKRMHETYSCFPSCSGCPMKGTNISHCRKVAFEHPERFAEVVMNWGEEHKSGVNEFSSNQEKQIDAVMDAAENLIRVLIKKPEYLAGSPLKDYYKTGEELPPIHPSEVADRIADMIGDSVNIYFPVHIEDETRDGRTIEHVRDTYNEPICNE